MKIGIDCRLSGKKHAGLGRYTENLVLEILPLSKEDTFVLFFTSLDQASEVLGKKQSFPNIKVVITPIKHYSLKEQLVLPWYYYKENLDLLHVPHFNVALLYTKPTVVTIHDLLWHEKRGGTVTTLNPVQYWIKYFFYHIVTGFAVHTAKSILVPSQTVAKTVTKYYPQAASKLVITKEGTNLTKPKTTKTKNVRKKNQLLYVGSLYPHKNIQLVIDGLRKLPQTTLIIVGARNVFLKKVEEYVRQRKLQHRVSFLGYVNDADLTKLYVESTALVQPSLSEGFGLTGLEAMKLGTPVLASDIPIFHEIYQDAAIFFNPHSVESFLNAYQMLSKKSLHHLTKHAQTVAAEYSWKKMAKKTAAVYQTIHEKK